MPEISGLGHVGLFCNDLPKMRDFYARVLGLTISDENLERGICFLSAAPDAEHHELALVQAKEPAQKTHNVQQVSFKVKRLDDVRAAMGIGQLEKLDEILASREVVAARYLELLGAIPGLELPCADDPDHERSWFVYVVTLPVETDREAVIARLDAHGIQTARYLPCIHLQPYMQQRFGFEAGLCPVAEELSSRTLALPFHARLGRDDQEYVAAALESALTS